MTQYLEAPTLKLEDTSMLHRHQSHKSFLTYQPHGVGQAEYRIATASNGIDTIRGVAWGRSFLPENLAKPKGFVV